MKRSTKPVWRTLVVGAVVVATAGGALWSCAVRRPTKVPIDVVALPAACARPVQTLLVLLPGAYDDPPDFIDRDFVGAVRRRGIAADIALVDAHMGYYRDRSLADRIEADVLAPARARGIRHVWLAGISLGGLGSLIVPKEERDKGGVAIDGVMLIAPYVGESEVIDEVARAGGPARWLPPASISDDDVGRRIWSWLRDLTAVPHDPALPEVYLGFGEDDRLAAGHRLLASALPGDHVFRAPGGHDWPPWTTVWNEMLDAAPLPRDASCARERDGKPRTGVRP